MAILTLRLRSPKTLIFETITPRNFRPLATLNTLATLGATTYKLNTMDKDQAGEESAGEPPSRTLVSCLGRHWPYAATVNPIKRVRLKTRSIAEEVIGLAFFFA